MHAPDLPPPTLHIPPATHATPSIYRTLPCMPLPCMPPAMHAPMPCMPLPCLPCMPNYWSCPAPLLYPPTLMDRMSDDCENITLSQTYVIMGGNKKMGLLCTTSRNSIMEVLSKLLKLVRILCWVCIIKCSILPKLFLLYLWTHSVSK